MGSQRHTADPASCPFEIPRPVMTQRWDHLTFLHWPYEPDAVQAMLPPSLHVDVTGGTAWVSLVPFELTVALPGIPPVPWVSRFLETNVRTYVIDDKGRAGVWFFSLDAARLGAVLTARAAYRLPYFWSAMSMERNANRVHYRCRRRWPDGGATSSVVVEIGQPYRPDELTALDHWLTARWRVFSRDGAHHRHAQASHPPWPLQRARALQIDDELVTAAGLSPMTAAPLVHYSPGVPVSIGSLRGINFRVTDLDDAVAGIRAEGVDVEVDSDDYPSGRFA